MKRTNCYFYYESQDMSARVPNCMYDFNYPYGHCPCGDDCPNYICKDEVRDIVRHYVNSKKEAKK